jgi:hypothetical protein
VAKLSALVIEAAWAGGRSTTCGPHAGTAFTAFVAGGLMIGSRVAGFAAG